MKPFSLRKRPPNTESTLRENAPGSAATPPHPTSAERSVVERTRQSAIATSTDMLREVAEGIAQGSRTPLEEYLESLWFLCDVVQVTHEAGKVILPLPASAVPSKETTPTIPEYVVNAKFLSDCHAFLTSQPQGYERLHIVSGSRLSPTCRTLDYMSKVALAAQSAIGATANDHSLRQALLELDAFGMALYGLFHSHPGAGASHTRPSSIDLETHERYERRYPLVGCIFVRDGYLRFFRHGDEPFTITIYGKGIQTINGDEHVYKIENFTSPISYETFATEDGS